MCDATHPNSLLAVQSKDVEVRVASGNKWRAVENHAKLKGHLSAFRETVISVTDGKHGKGTGKVLVDVQE